jgi:putative FmdB family regulatory protein
MPIYEYKCQQCGADYEVRQSVSDEPLTTCEKCHGKLEKQWSLSGFQFKGEGWYVTDYSKKAGGAAEKSSASESTPAADTASKPEPAKVEKKTAKE